VTIPSGEKNFTIPEMKGKGLHTGEEMRKLIQEVRMTTQSYKVLTATS